MTASPLTRKALPLLLTAVLLGLASGVPAPAQTPAAPPAAADPQLDRIEGKLDEILRRLDAQAPLQAAKPAAARPAVTAPAAPTATQPPPKPALAATPETTAYKTGAVAIAHAAPDKSRDLQAIPSDIVGSFVYSGGPVTLHDLKSNGVRYTGLTGLELQGWLKVTVAGRTQLAVEFKATTSGNAMGASACFTTIWLEDHSIGAQTGEIPTPAIEEKAIDLVLGADLQPGLYRLRAWAACTPARGLKLSAELLAKGPNDMNLRPVTGDELLHQGQ